jgi:NAD(P)H-hydrate epimerase
MFMKIATSGQMNEIDSRTINEIGIPGTVLMENASLKVVEEVLKSLGNAAGKSVFILAGKGNNGGDAFAVARHLFNMGADTKVYIVANKKDVKNDAALNLNILEKMKVGTVELLEDFQIPQLETALKAADLIIDGVLGTGLRVK